MRFCPYAINRHMVQQTINEFDADGNHLGQQVIEHNTADFLECKQSHCGAWKDGRCQYRGIE